MRIVFVLILLVGFGLAGSAVYMVMQRFNAYEAEVTSLRRVKTPDVEISSVAVAAEDLEFGHQLLPENIKLVSWPVNAIPEGAFTTIESLMGDLNSEPRSILRTIGKDEAILAGRVSEFGQDAGIRSRLSPGTRAFTIGVSVSTGVSGFLKPNDYVDIYWSGGDGNRGTITRLLMENIRLVAVDQSANEDDPLPKIAKTVTVEVSPQVVAQLTQAQVSGQLSLSLRGTDDFTASAVENVDLTDITGREIKEIQEDRECFTRTRKGTEVIEVPAPCTD